MQAQTSKVTYALQGVEFRPQWYPAIMALGVRFGYLSQRALENEEMLGKMAPTTRNSSWRFKKWPVDKVGVKLCLVGSF